MKNRSKLRWVPGDMDWSLVPGRVQSEIHQPKTRQTVLEHERLEPAPDQQLGTPTTNEVPSQHNTPRTVSPEAQTVCPMLMVITLMI